MTSEGVSLHDNPMTEQRMKTDAGQEAQPPVTHTGSGGCTRQPPNAMPGISPSLRSAKESEGTNSETLQNKVCGYHGYSLSHGVDIQLSFPDASA